MKTITRFLFASLLLVSSVSQAQEWAPEGATWYHKFIYGWWGRVGYIKTTANGQDSTILGHQCRVLYRAIDGSTNFTRLCMYADSGKVFFYDTVLNDFHKAYDFNADTSESWIVTPKWGDKIDSILIKPVYKGQVTINGKTVRRDSLSFEYIGHNHSFSLPYGVQEAIEYIGCTGTDLVPWWREDIVDGPYIGSLRCYSDSYMGNINRTNQECEAGMKERRDDIPFKLFPNPATSSFTIQFQAQPRQNPEIKIFDITGKVCAGIQWNSIDHSISISGLHPGLYFVKIGSHTEKLLIR